MSNCTICSRLNEAKKVVCGGASSACQLGSTYAAAAYAAVCAWVAGLVISEALLLKTFFISLGILIGSAFSDFFKKHRVLVFFVMIGSLVLFLYKAISEIDEDEF